jgi:hypothetical protein
MTPEETLVELLAMVGAAKGSASLISSADLSNWPISAVSAMKSQKILTKSKPASTVVCPGCEDACTMPVNTFPEGMRKASWFVVCDKRDDINRIPVSADDLEQWQADPEAICGFVATALRIRRSGQSDAGSGNRSIGIATGKKRSQMLCLALSDDPSLIVGDGQLPLGDAVSFGADGYFIDSKMIEQFVDQSNVADPRYTPSNARREVRKLKTAAKYEAWRREYRRLLKSHPDRSDVWYSQKIAKMPVAQGAAPDTIRKRMKA